MEKMAESISAVPTLLIIFTFDGSSTWLSIVAVCWRRVGFRRSIYSARARRFAQRSRRLKNEC